MTITIADRRGELWQWDTGRRVKITDDAGGYTKVQQDFAVHKRARPADYVYTPTEHAGFDRLRAEIGDLDDLTTENKSTIVDAINEVARSGGGGTKYQIGNGLILDAKTNTLAVDTADAVERDNTKPITSAGVYLEIGNINALLATI